MTKLYSSGKQIYPETRPENVIDQESGKDIKVLVQDMFDENTQLAGVVNLAASGGKTTLKNVYNSLSVNELKYLLVTDSSGNLPSLNNEKAVTMHADVAQLFGAASLGASVGDIVIVAKVKVLLVNVPVYKVFPLNDAKAADGSFPGAMGLESVWDKTQVNKIPDLETKVNGSLLPTRSGSNMNECIAQGVYPWCTLGRPEGSTGAYTLFVKRSSTADGNGFYTVEQTAYGRQDEIGQVFKRLVFTKADGTAEYGDWIKISN